MNMWALNEVRGFRPHVLRRLNHGILLVGHFRDRKDTYANNYSETRRFLAKLKEV
jgi:hypothetical protein